VLNPGGAGFGFDSHQLPARNGNPLPCVGRGADVDEAGIVCPVTSSASSRGRGGGLCHRKADRAIGVQHDVVAAETGILEVGCCDGAHGVTSSGGAGGANWPSM